MGEIKVNKVDLAFGRGDGRSGKEGRRSGNMR